MLTTAERGACVFIMCVLFRNAPNISSWSYGLSEKSPRGGTIGADVVHTIARVGAKSNAPRLLFRSHVRPKHQLLPIAGR